MLDRKTCDKFWIAPWRLVRHVSLPRWPPLDLSLQPLVARPADPAELKEKSFVLKARNQSQRHPPPEMVHPLKVGWRQTTACILHLQANPPCWQSQSWLPTSILSASSCQEKEKESELSVSSRLPWLPTLVQELQCAEVRNWFSRKLALW